MIGFDFPVRSDAISSDPKTDNRIDAALYNHLLGVAAIPLIGSAAGSVLVATASWGSVDEKLLSGWLFLVFAVILVRIRLTQRSIRHIKQNGYKRVEALVYAWTTGLSGIAWGICGLLVNHADTPAKVVIITAIQSMIMGGVLTLGAFLASFLAFALPEIIPMMVVLLVSGGVANTVLSIYSLIFLVLMIGIARRYNRSLRQTWQLTFDNQDLLSALTQANDRLAILAETDGMTGLANRRRIDEALVTEFSRLRRSNAPSPC